MWLILPDEGVPPEELLNDEKVAALYLGGETKYKQVMLNLSVPKFDVSSDIDLIGQLQTLGVTDVFQPGAADFSPMTEQPDGLAVTEAKHAARVMIDEKGCLAAAYTVILTEGAAMPPDEEADLILDRPFLFVLTAKDGSVLFMGIVNDPTAKE
jgi:serpin B